MPLYTKMLSVEEYGVLEFSYSVSAFVAIILGAGLAHTTLRFYFDRADDARGRVIVTSFYLISFYAVPILFLVYYFSGYINGYTLEVVNGDYYIRLLVVIIYIELLNEIFYAYLRASDRALTFIIVSFGKLILQVSISIVALSYMDMKIDGVLYANMIGLLSIWLYLISLVVKNCGFRYEKAVVFPMLRYSLPIAGSSLLGVVIVNSDKIFLKEIIGYAAVGIYALASKFALILSYSIYEPFQKAYGPYRFSIMNDEDAGEQYSRVSYLSIVLACIVMVPINLFSQEVIYSLATVDYHEAHQFILPLTLSVVFQIMAYNFQTPILIQKKTGSILNITMISAVFNIFAMYFLIKTFGIMGGGLGMLVTNALIAVLTLKLAVNYMVVHYKHIRSMIVIFVAVVFSLPVFFMQPGLIASQLAIKLFLVVLFLSGLFFFDSDIRAYSQKLLFNKLINKCQKV